MPTKIEKDDVSGQMTTGHEWDGLRELNRPLPKWWVYVLYATIVWGVIYMIAMPSVPGLTGYYRGVLGYSQRARVTSDVAEVAARRAAAMDKIRTLGFADIRKDPSLHEIALTAGRITFADNCQPCHGAGGGGNPGYPALAAGNWLWGGTLEDIQQTVTHGIRSADPEARQSAMPRFGADGVLKPDEIQAVTDYVAAMYGLPGGAGAARGKQIYADNCVPCHGENGQGNREVGGPKLAAKLHLFGATRADIAAQIANPHLGVMPNWGGRLDEGKIKSVALYVHALGGGE